MQKAKDQHELEWLLALMFMPSMLKVRKKMETGY
jgi:hypothetical protein